MGRVKGTREKTGEQDRGCWPIQASKRDDRREGGEMGSRGLGFWKKKKETESTELGTTGALK